MFIIVRQGKKKIPTVEVKIYFIFFSTLTRRNRRMLVTPAKKRKKSGRTFNHPTILQYLLHFFFAIKESRQVWFPSSVVNRPYIQRKKYHVQQTKRFPKNKKNRPTSPKRLFPIVQKHQEYIVKLLRKSDAQQRHSWVGPSVCPTLRKHSNFTPDLLLPSSQGFSR